MKKLTMLLVGFVSLVIVGCGSLTSPTTVKGEKILTDESSNPTQYALWDEDDRVWRYIMLPGTSLGFTAYEWNSEEEELEQIGKPTKTEPGHPTRLDEIDWEVFQPYTANDFGFASDGMVLLKKNGIWTVVTPEVFDELVRRGVQLPN